jgi:hypothetical protein
MPNKPTGRRTDFEEEISTVSTAIIEEFRNHPVSIASRRAEAILFAADDKFGVLSSDEPAITPLESTNGVKTPLPSANLKLFLLGQLFRCRKITDMDFPLIGTVVQTVDLLEQVCDGEIERLRNKIEKRQSSPQHTAQIRDILILQGRAHSIRQIIFQKITSHVTRSNGDSRATALKLRFCQPDPDGL